MALLLLFCCLTPLSGMAQDPPPSSPDAPRVEIFGGYSFLHADLGDTEYLNGFHVSAALNPKKWVGMAADLSSSYGKTTTITAIDTFTPNIGTQLLTFGPRFSLRSEMITSFGHVMFGVARIRQSNAPGLTNPTLVLMGGTETAPAVQFGGGVDLNATDSLAIRIFQADYLMTFFNSARQNHIRLSTGVVLRLGTQ